MRYHLYTNLAEPLSHVVSILRSWWKLDDDVSLHSFVSQREGQPSLSHPKADQAFLNSFASSPAALPILWNDTNQSIESDSAQEIIQRWRDNANLPAQTKQEASWIHLIQHDLLASIHRAGFASKQAEYEDAFAQTEATLDRLDQHLNTSRFLCGNNTPNEADAWLFSVLVRFDVAYYGLYKCNPKRLVHYPNLSPYLRDIYQWEDTASTVDFEQIRNHHYWQDERINPKRLVPKGGIPNLRLFHNREERFGQREIQAIGTEEEQGKKRQKGEWVRKRSNHRDIITANGSSGFAAEKGRYHLYVANNCPWCHRAVLARKLNGLEDIISMDVLYYRRDPDHGWQFKPEVEGCTPDTVNGVKYIKELYERVGSEEKSVPVLWDKKTNTIVNNESAEIIRMMNDAFQDITDVTTDFYPTHLQAEIDEWNAWVYQHINNGAYKAGFASTQEAYSTGYDNFFAALDRLDRVLQKRKFLCGEQLTEADIRLFPTIYRFDHVYYTRFKLNHKMVRDYNNLFRWFQDMMSTPGVQEASNLEHCKQGYFGRTGNNIIPHGPNFTLEQEMEVY